MKINDDYLEVPVLIIFWDKKEIVVTPTWFEKKLINAKNYIGIKPDDNGGYTATALMDDGLKITTCFAKEWVMQIFPNMFPEERKVS